MTILHPSFNAAGVISRTRENGIITGSADYAADGQCVLTNLDRATEARKGDQVITTGLGGVFPANLLVGTVQEVTGTDGLIYAVKTLRNGYESTSPNGEVVSFIYDKKTNSWSQEQDGKQVEIFRFNPDGTIQARLSDGQTLRVKPDEAGVFEARMAVNGARFWACR